MKALQKWMLYGTLVGSVYALIAFAPASWLAAAMASASGGAVLLEAPRGTAWQGSADLLLSGGNGSEGAARLPSRLEWQISPAWLGLDVRLGAPCCTSAASPVRLGLRVGSLASMLNVVVWRLDVTRLDLPAALLAGLGAPWNTLQLMGELALSSDQWAGHWSRAHGLTDVTGHAALVASNMATALSTVKPLGSYRLSWMGATLQLETLGGAPTEAAFILTGTGHIEQGLLRFQGEALAAKGFEGALSGLLHIVGQWQPSADGRGRAVLKL